MLGRGIGLPVTTPVVGREGHQARQLLDLVAHVAGRRELGCQHHGSWIGGAAAVMDGTDLGAICRLARGLLAVLRALVWAGRLGRASPGAGMQAGAGLGPGPGTTVGYEEVTWIQNVFDNSTSRRNICVFALQQSCAGVVVYVLAVHVLFTVQSGLWFTFACLSVTRGCTSAAPLLTAEYVELLPVCGDWNMLRSGCHSLPLSIDLLCTIYFCVNLPAAFGLLPLAQVPGMSGLITGMVPTIANVLG